ncbi:MAG: class I SAM-dependent methyltransferase [Candidatus Methylomirabilis oxyfera]|nr:class I SAM-dependent methyltransferase [Candidatus Methylomirabilis oxyfera]
MPNTVPCNLCGSARGVPQSRKARFLNIPEPFGVCRCQACGLIYLNPRPTIPELAEMYATHPYFSADNATRGKPRRRFYASRMERLERWRPQRGTMLGIGCLEGGYALEVAQNRGWRVSAIEFSPILAAHAREQLGVEVEVVDAWDLSSIAGGRFDVIYSHSLEHFPDPRASLRQCRKLLPNQGLLMVEAPNTFRSIKSTLQRAIIYLAGSNAQQLFFGEVPAGFHLYYFSPRSVRAMLESEGFEILELRTYLPRHPVYHGNPRLGWLQELFYAVGGPFDRGPTIEVIARVVG